MKIAAAILVAFILAAPAGAQNGMHYFQHLTVKDGLSQSSVVAVAQDSTGFMWFATQDGLNRYDGRKFIYYEKYFDDITNAKNNRLGRIYVDSRNDVWIIPNTHVPEKYNRFKNTFTPLTGMNNISCILQDSKNNYWFGTLDDEVIKTATDSKRTTYKVQQQPGEAPNSIHQLFEDSRGRIWLGAKNGLYYFNEKLHNFMPVKLPGGIGNIYCMAEDHHQTLWAGSLGMGLLFKQKNDSVFRAFSFSDKDLSTAINSSGLIIESIAADSDNNLWVGTYGNGLLLIKNNDQTVLKYLPDKNNPYSFNYKDVLCILSSKYNLTWLGTDGGGINLYDKNYTRFNAFTANAVPQGIAVDIIRCIYKDKYNNTWLGTSGKGLTRYNPSLAVKWKTWIYEKDIVKTANNSNRVLSLYGDEDGLLWIGTQGNGLMWFNNAREKFSYFKDKGPGFPDKSIRCLYPAGNGNVWAGTEDSGLCLLSKQKGLLRQVAATTDNKNKAPVKNIRCIEKINDTILCLGTDETGLFEYNTQHNTMTALALPDTVSGKLLKVKSLYYDTATRILFIGTNGNGMAAYNLKNMKADLYTVQDGLPNNVVYGIVPGNDHVLWLSTNKGLCSFSFSPNQGKPIIHLYDEKDGLQNTEFNTGAHFKDAEGNIYFGGIDGFNYFSPANITNRPATGNIVFTDCYIGGKQYNGDSAIETRHLLTLGPGENEFSVSFALLNYSTPRQLNYQYQLKGYDKRVINAGADNTANYTNLTPGLYHLLVTASNNDGSTITKPAMLSILVRPMFYQTLWFKVLGITFLALLIYRFVYWRIQSVRKQEQLKQMRTVAEMKALRAQMNPHFIFNCLNAIDNLIQTNQKDKATTYLARFAKLIRNVLDSSKNNLVPFNKDYDTLVLYLTLEQFRLNNKFEYTITADDELMHADYKVPPLIIQPFVENAIHHGLMNKTSGDKKLAIKMQLENDFIKYSIIDNGIGRRSAAELKSINRPEHFSYGIEISRERAALHNNHSNGAPALLITDLQENGHATGTKVEIWIAV